MLAGVNQPCGGCGVGLVDEEEIVGAASLECIPWVISDLNYTENVWNWRGYPEDWIEPLTWYDSSCWWKGQETLPWAEVASF